MIMEITLLIMEKSWKNHGILFLNFCGNPEYNIHALVLLNLLNSLRKRDKMLGKPRILSLFPNSFNKFNKT